MTLLLLSAAPQCRQLRGDPAHVPHLQHGVLDVRGEDGEILRIEGDQAEAIVGYFFEVESRAFDNRFGSEIGIGFQFFL